MPDSSGEGPVELVKRLRDESEPGQQIALAQELYQSAIADVSSKTQLCTVLIEDQSVLLDLLRLSCSKEKKVALRVALLLRILCETTGGKREGLEERIVATLTSLLKNTDQGKVQEGIRIAICVHSFLLEALQALSVDQSLWQCLYDTYFSCDETTCSTLFEYASICCVNPKSIPAVEKFFERVGDSINQRSQPSVVRYLSVRVKLSAARNASTGEYDEDLQNSVLDFLTRSEVKDEYLDVTLDTLAFATTAPSIKNMLCSDTGTLGLLLDAIKSGRVRKSSIHSALHILHNLVTRPKPQDDLGAQVQKLKLASQPNTRRESEPLESIDRRCRVLVDSDVMSVLMYVIKNQTVYPHLLVCSIVTGLAELQSCRSKLAAQGAVRILNAMWEYDQAEKSKSSSGTESEISKVAACGIAKILTRTDPSLLFSGGRRAETTVLGPLFHLLQSEPGSYSDVAVYEALLSITNLASSDGHTRDAVIQRIWDVLGDFMITSNLLVRRSAIELHCNLALSDEIIRKLLSSQQGDQRLDLILAYMDSDDLASRIAATGSIAILTESPDICNIITRKSGRIELLLRLAGNDDEQVKLRCASALRNIADSSPANCKQILASPGLGKIQTSIQSSRGQLLEIWQDFLSILKASQQT